MRLPIGAPANNSAKFDAFEAELKPSRSRDSDNNNSRRLCESAESHQRANSGLSLLCCRHVFVFVVVLVVVDDLVFGVT